MKCLGFRLKGYYLRSRWFNVISFLSFRLKLLIVQILRLSEPGQIVTYDLLHLMWQEKKFQKTQISQSSFTVLLNNLEKMLTAWKHLRLYSLVYEGLLLMNDHEPTRTLCCLCKISRYVCNILMRLTYQELSFYLSRCCWHHKYWTNLNTIPVVHRSQLLSFFEFSSLKQMNRYRY